MHRYIDLHEDAVGARGPGASGCFLVTRKRLAEGFAFGAAGSITVVVILAVLQLRSELRPFIEVLKGNIAYSQGALIGSKTMAGSLKAHLSRVSIQSFYVLILGIVVAFLISWIALSAEQDRWSRTVAFTVCGFLSLLVALATLAVVGMWPHHNQVLYISSVLAVLCLSPLFDLRFTVAPFLTLFLVVAIALLLGGAPTPGRYIDAFKRMPNNISALRKLSPEAQRLLASGPPGMYARLGTNTDQGHAFGLKEWKLACARFHQYKFESISQLMSVLDCASTARTVIVSESLVSDLRFPPGWNEFVGKVESLLATDYSCDAREGLRICKRIGSAR